MSVSCNSSEKTASESCGEVYPNVFEAIRAVDPQCPACNGATGDGSLIRQQAYEPVLLADFTVGMLENRDASVLFRGETALYPSCKPSLYRIADWRVRLAAQVKAWDFMMLLADLAEVREWLADGYRVHFSALAQHYGFATDMLDLTSDVVVAAFFATHRFNAVKQQFDVITDGIGRLRYVEASAVGERAFPIGLQPFERPGLQSGYGLVLGEDEDFAEMSESILFVQDEMLNRRFSRAVLGNAMFLPDERITWAADILSKAPVVTRSAVRAFCAAGAAGEQRVEGDVAEALAGAGIRVVDAPLVSADDVAAFRRAMRERVHRVTIERPARF